MNYYSQLDARWADMKVGFGSGTFRDVGCTVTTFCNWYNKVFGTDFHPDEVNEKLKTARAFDGSLLLWKNIPMAFPRVKFLWRGYNYNNVTVSFYVYVKGLPVMVEVNNHGTKHWVLYIGGRQLADPLGGVLRPTSFYPATGYSLLQSA